MKKILSVWFLLAATAAVGACAQAAPELPPDTRPDEVTFDDGGEMYVRNYCVTCDDCWCPGPESCCNPPVGPVLNRP